MVLAEVADEGGLGVKVVNGDVEEALDLRGVEIHGEHPVERPAEVRRLATSFAVIGTRGWSFLSWRAYPKKGMTAVIRSALARRAASTRMSSSMMLSVSSSRTERAG